MQDLITALGPDPQDPNLVHVFIDGRHALAVSVDVAAEDRLTVGQACPPDRLERLHRAQERHQAFELALNFLSYRPRSAREVEMRLRKKGYTPEQIEQTLSRLRERGYVDDREFARFWITNRQTFSPRGPHLLRSELRQKGVPSDIVEEALNEYRDDQAQRAEEAAEVAAEYDLPDDEPVPGSDEATALGLARKRMRLLAGLDPQVTRRRLYGFLARRGYGFDTIDKVVRRVLKPEETDDAADAE